MTACCANCIFWIDADAKKENGGNYPTHPESLNNGMGIFDCRRRAPIVAASTGRGFWPRTFHDDWCGDHVLRRSAA